MNPYGSSKRFTTINLDSFFICLHFLCYFFIFCISEAVNEKTNEGNLRYYQQVCPSGQIMLSFTLALFSLDTLIRSKVVRMLPTAKKRKDNKKRESKREETSKKSKNRR
jgi:hypothetical protein